MDESEKKLIIANNKTIKIFITRKHDKNLHPLSFWFGKYDSDPLSYSDKDNEYYFDYVRFLRHYNIKFIYGCNIKHYILSFPYNLRDYLRLTDYKKNTLIIWALKMKLKKYVGKDPTSMIFNFVFN